MPAVVRGGRRQNAGQPPKRAAAPKSGGRGRTPKNAPGVPGKMAVLGRLDMSPRAVIIAMVAGVVVLGGVLATGARAERIGNSMSNGLDGATAAMGLKLAQVDIRGESPEANAAIRRAIGASANQPMTSLDLDAIRQRVEQVGWVKEARVVRLLPDRLVVQVIEHDRLAVWQSGGRNFVVDAKGQVIEGADAGRYPNLPLVVGAGANETASEILPLIAERPRLQSRVEAMVRVDNRRWNLLLKDGGLIQLPATDQEAALIRLDALDQRERLLELGFARIDLRTPEELAVRRSDSAT
ncbi:MAG: cell division protein FtsQ/DivIB [Brevundimonas sp.]|uniref:cell division protein FtsQ/DivIB n=1 Tax=Brevundimonas sp. TaxID=1871086 RepID=UPI001A288D1D|nr:cell division protein FtsQ/DivIB [Brevundimonas sp.]MBJ7448518.1 cell division protein FtsQ/DivIB [Brevundimonas sp.]